MSMVQIGWIDFSEDERNRANQILQASKSKGAIDELGLGILRDAFAYRFFPGSSTLHTHARYYFLTAYLMKDIANQFQGAGRDKVDSEYVFREKATAKALKAWYSDKNIEPEGIVGINSLTTNSWVKQKPSSMNWAAMREYGILKDKNMSLSAYLNLVAAPGHKQLDADSEGDDADLLLTHAQALWNVPLEGYSNWNSDNQISMDLLECEAIQLKEAIIQAGPESLYAVFLNKPEVLELAIQTKNFITFADELPNIFPSCPDLEALQLAADFSALAALLHIRFNYVLRHNDSDTPDEESETEWQAGFDKDSGYWLRAQQCDIARIFQLFNLSSFGRDGETKTFLINAQVAMKNNNLDELDDLIKTREKLLKGPSRSKILNSDVYRNEWYGGKDLPYRLYIAINIVKEIYKGLEVQHD